MFKRGDNHDNFMNYVELHERSWGMDSYKDRPKLEAILQAPVVAFWRPAERGESRHIITLYDSVDELNEELSSMLLHSSTRPIKHRLFRLFYKQKRIYVKGVRLLLAKGRD